MLLLSIWSRRIFPLLFPKSALFLLHPGQSRRQGPRRRRPERGLNHLFDALHHNLVIRVGFIQLDHREFRIVLRAEPFIAEIPADLKNPLHSAHQQTLQVEFRTDPQIELHVERVVVRDEGPRRRTSVDRLQQRRLNFEIVLAEQVVANRLNDRAALPKDLRNLGVGEQVNVAPPVTQVHVGQPMPFFRRRAQRLRQNRQPVGPQRQLSGSGSADDAVRADDIAQVKLPDDRPLIAEIRLAEAELERSAPIPNGHKGQLAHDAQQGDSAGNAGTGFAALTGRDVEALRLPAHRRRWANIGKPAAVRLNAHLRQGVKLALTMLSKLILLRHRPGSTVDSVVRPCALPRGDRITVNGSQQIRPPRVGTGSV